MRYAVLPMTIVFGLILIVQCAHGEAVTSALRIKQGSFATASSLVPETLYEMKPLKAWENFQPVDAAIGSLAVESFGPLPTEAPKGEVDGSLDPCPVLKDWPSVVEIDAPNPCNMLFPLRGNWTRNAKSGSSRTGLQMMNWATSCSAMGGGTVPVTSYTLPNGTAFGTSSLATTLFGTTVKLTDCTGYVRYHIDEKVYNVVGQTDDSACAQYGSCAGTIYVQYFIRDWAGKEIARTAYLRLFQHAVKLQDVNGNLIAEAKRIGSWNPMSHECNPRDPHRKWQIKYPDASKVKGVSAVLSKPSDRWVMAQLVTIMSSRDHNRLSNGLVSPTACEAQKSVLLAVVLAFAFLVISGGAIMFLRVGLVPTQMFFVELEDKLCPKRMLKPTRPVPVLFQG